MKRCSEFISAALSILLCFTAGNDTYAETETLHIAVATDLHYIAPQLTDRGELFKYVAGSNDGKLMQYTEEILDAFGNGEADILLGTQMIAK